jgi:DNA polymerase III alpha subunit
VLIETGLGEAESQLCSCANGMSTPAETTETKASGLQTQLAERQLFYDGTSLVHPAQVPAMLLAGVPVAKLRVTELDEDIALFNQLSDEPLQLGAPAPAEIVLDRTWLLPSQWQELDLGQLIADALTAKGLATSQAYVERAAAELAEVERRGMAPFVRCLAYIVHELRRAGQVWGVGRGSSCASLLLFLLDVHKVDPVKFNIPASEFFHD